MAAWLDSIMSPLNAAGEGLQKLIETRDLDSGTTTHYLGARELIFWTTRQELRRGAHPPHNVIAQHGAL